ncbi:uncharacterized protein TNCT_420171, partial [Trichonephila clavata]
SSPRLSQNFSQLHEYQLFSRRKNSMCYRDVLEPFSHHDNCTHDNLLRSRHTSSNVYNIWIRTGIGHNPNNEWYCQCKVGARVVGSHAHVASVLWYLEYWRHNHTQTKTPSLGYADTLQDVATGWSSDNSASESEKEI